MPQILSSLKKNPVLAGVLIMLVADLLFAFNDAVGKWLMMSFSVGPVLVVRSLGAFFVLGPMLARQGIHDLVKVERPLLQALKVACAAADVALFYAAVVHLPLATVVTFYMAAPIYIAALSPFLLGETIGWRRWLAIAIGFCGVLVILRPSNGLLSPSTVLALLGSVAFAMSIILSRRLRATSDTTLVTWQTLGTLAIGLVMSIGTWAAPGGLDLTAMLLLGVVACIAHMMTTRALKLASASTLAPLQYTLLPWAALFGYFFFAEVPDISVIAGSAIIVLSGLFIFHRQGVVAEVPEEAVPKSVH